MNLKKNIAALSLRVTYAILSLGLSILLARALGVEQYGAYAWALAVISLVSLPVVAGIPELVVRQTAKLSQSNSMPDLYSFWKWAFIRVTTLSLLIVITLQAAVFFVSLPSIEDRLELLKIGAFSVPVVAGCILSAAIIRGAIDPILGMLTESLIRPFLGLVLVGLLVFLLGRIDAVTALFSYALSAFLAILITLPMAIRKILHVRASLTERKRIELIALEKSLLPLSLIGGMHFLNSFLDLLILGLFHGNNEVGEYKVAAQFSILVSFALQAINQLIQPSIATYFNEQKFFELQSLLRRSVIFASLFAITTTAFLYTFGILIIKNIFGVGFTGAEMPMLILVIGQLVNALFGSAGSVLNMTGYERLTLRGLAISLLLNLLFGLALVPEFGSVGAATATMITLIAWNFFLRRAALKNLNLDTSVLSILTASKKPSS